VDSLPPAPPSVAVPGSHIAPGEFYPRDSRERELCRQASRPDWLYVAGLAALDAGSFWLTSVEAVKGSGIPIVRYSGPVAVGLAWGGTIGGGWLALPKCSMSWVGEPPLEGDSRAAWPLALSLTLLAGATAPVINGVFVGSEPPRWSTEERAGHVIAAGLAGVGGALLPYLMAPRTWSAARELQRIRIAADMEGRIVVSYAARF